MPYRKMTLGEKEMYHVFTKSIAGFKIFNDEKDFSRLKNTLSFYSIKNPPCRFSWFNELNKKTKIINSENQNKLVDIVAYCIMPTHIHLILVNLIKDGISKFMNRVLLSYSKYFNLKHKRKGPLWESRFKSVLLNTDEQLLHLTRYVHLNPVTAKIINKPEDWQFSSFNEFLGRSKEEDRICVHQKYIDCEPGLYRSFVEEQIEVQIELARLKLFHIPAV